MKKIIKIIKIIGLVGLGLLAITALAYLAIAFIKVEANPFNWESGDRAFMVFIVFCYLFFSPLLVMWLDDISD